MSRFLEVLIAGDAIGSRVATDASIHTPGGRTRPEEDSRTDSYLIRLLTELVLSVYFECW